jgi:hypothetical protein
MRGPRDPSMSYLVPTVVEQTVRGERAYDIFSRLLLREGADPIAVRSAMHLKTLNGPSAFALQV